MTYYGDHLVIDSDGQSLYMPDDQVVTEH